MDIVAGATPAPAESVALWVVCRLGVAGLPSFFNLFMTLCAVKEE